MELTINIPGLKELAEAVKMMAEVRQVTAPQPEATPAVPVQQAAAQVGQVQPQGTHPVPASVQPAQSPQQQMPVQAAQQPIQQQAPVQAAPTQPVQQQTPAAVPTAPHTYTQDDLARAAMTLMDSGRQSDLLGLLASFGVASLPALHQEQYGPFATALRGLGAQI